MNDLSRLSVSCTVMGVEGREQAKPGASSPGKGRSMINGPQDMSAGRHTALAGGRVNRAHVVVEACIDFEYEITLLRVRTRAAG